MFYPHLHHKLFRLLQIHVCLRCLHRCNLLLPTCHLCPLRNLIDLLGYHDFRSPRLHLKLLLHHCIGLACHLHQKAYLRGRWKCSTLCLAEALHLKSHSHFRTDLFPNHQSVPLLPPESPCSPQHLQQLSLSVKNPSQVTQTRTTASSAEPPMMS